MSAAGWKHTSAIHGLFRQLSSTSFMEKRIPEFRVSMLPYCGVYDIYKSRNPWFKNTFQYMFYTHVGHAIHKAMQTHLSKFDSSIPYGNWSCNRVLSKKEKNGFVITKKCNKIIKHCTLKEAEKSLVCKHGEKNCKTFLSY